MKNGAEYSGRQEDAANDGHGERALVNGLH
jgi:hypothetical protein